MGQNDVKAGYWLYHKEGEGPKIDAKLFSHLFCGYADFDSSSCKVMVPDGDYTFKNFSSMVKESNPNVKTLLSIRVEHEKAGSFAKMASDSESRALFIYSTMEVAKRGHFDGLDLQWLYPSSHKEMDDLRDLLTEWNSAVAYDAMTFHIQQRCCLDWVNLISYDYYTPINSITETAPSSAFSCSATVIPCASTDIEEFIKSGLAAEKIVFGIPFYGWAWKLMDPKQNGVFSPAAGAAEGPNIAADGRVDYLNVKKFIHSQDHWWISNLSINWVVEYAYFDKTWIAYEGEGSIMFKIFKAKNNFSGLRGYYTLDVEADDGDRTLAKTAAWAWERA